MSNLPNSHQFLSWFTQTHNFFVYRYTRNCSAELEQFTEAVRLSQPDELDDLFRDYLAEVNEMFDSVLGAAGQQITSDQHQVEDVATNIIQFSQDKLADLQTAINNL